ncbi:hypothetical protein [Aliikangiella maris]|uniref:Uncharacterized protein n=2 Tax=Aliikangiella maris TaxID=3162458 RepID=A0ABV2BPY4_9GAMM
MFYSLLTLLSGLLVYHFLSVQSLTEKQAFAPLANQSITAKSATSHVKHLIEVTQDSRVWLQGWIIICAYCGFKSLDNFGLFASQVLHMNAVESANLVTWASYTRPIAAILAGLVADRWQIGKQVALCFTLTLLSFLLLGLLHPYSMTLNIVVFNIVITFIAVYALRGIYFALVEASGIKQNTTGTAVGLISLIGFTPDIFFASLTGRILDASPGASGFQHYFLLLAGISAAGLLATIWLNSKTLSAKKIK